MVKTKQISNRLLNKYKNEAIKNKKESWLFAYFTDCDKQEQLTGKTVEFGLINFNTNKKLYTIFDAPGHNMYIPNMIYASYQSDISLLVVSARNGEFETGFHKGGQTREHANISYTLGHKRIILVINKMDTISWNQSRYNMITKKVTKFLKKVGFKSKHIKTIPISAYQGDNISKPVSSNICNWYKGDCLLTTLDNIKNLKRKNKKPLRMSVLYSSSIYDNTNNGREIKNIIGVCGKIQSGTIAIDDEIIILPINKSFVVTHIFKNNVSQNIGYAGDILTIGLDISKHNNINCKELSRGNVVCHLSDENTIPVVRMIKVKIQCKNVDETGLVAQGYQCIMHCHNIETQCELIKVNKIDKKGKLINQKFLRKDDFGVCVIKTKDLIAVEKFSNYQEFGRIILRNGNKTIGIGIIEFVKKIEFEKRQDVIHAN